MHLLVLAGVFTPSTGKGQQQICLRRGNIFFAPSEANRVGNMAVICNLTHVTPHFLSTTTSNGTSPNPPAAANGSKPKPTAAATTTTTSSTTKPNAWSRPLKTTPAPPATTKTPPLSRQNTPPPPPGYKAQDAVPRMTAADELQLRAGHRERALHMWLNLVGTKVSLHLTTGTVLEGIFHTATPLPMAKPSMRNKYVLKAVQVVKSGEEEKEDIVPGSIVVVDMHKVVQMHVKSLPKAATLGQQRNNQTAFTDTEISGAAAQPDKSRDLQEAGSAWTTPNGSAGGAALESGGRPLNSRAEALGGGGGGSGSNDKTPPSTSGLAGSIGGWDQFKANEELFNVKGSYDESLYTTSLDKQSLSASKIAKAERLAKEIEGTVATNWHVAEERNQKVQGDYDEEDLYSGVLPEAKAATAAAPAPASTLSYAKVAKASSDEKGTKTTSAAEKEESDPSETKKEEKKVKKPSADEPPKLADEKAGTEKPKEEPAKKEEKPAAGDKKDSTAKSSLNPGAKEFTMNVNAREFTPKFAAPSPEPQQSHPPPIDPNTGMPIHMQPHMPPGQAGANPYMHPPQPGEFGIVSGKHLVISFWHTYNSSNMSLFSVRNDANDGPTVCCSLSGWSVPWHGTSYANATTAATAIFGTSQWRRPSHTFNADKWSVVTGWRRKWSSNNRR